MQKDGMDGKEIIVYIKNMGMELKDLFRAYLTRKDNESKRLMYGSNYGSTFQGRMEVNIYFYEWSDVFSTPRRFYDAISFELFLEKSGIELEDAHKTFLAHMPTVYVTCKKGSKELVFRNTYVGLQQAVKGY